MAATKKSAVPPVPQSPAALATTLTQHCRYALSKLGEAFFRGSVTSGNDGNIALIFVSRRLQFLPGSGCEIFVDGTFHVCPRMFRQLLTVHTKYDGVYIPVAFVPMTRRTAGLYAAVWRKLVSITSEGSSTRSSAFAPRKVMADFESAIHTSMAQVFPQVEVKGCFFHYTQAVIRKARHFRLNPRSETVRLLCAIPSLPSHLMQRGFQAICERITDQPANMTALLAYITRFWLDRVAPETLSHYGEIDRTNNAVEGFHSRLRWALHGKPGVYAFVDELRRQDYLATKKVQAIWSDERAVVAERGRRRQVKVHLMNGSRLAE